MAQIPDGPEHLKCPLLHEPMSKVCKTCAFWMEIERGDAGGRPVRDWMCAISAVALAVAAQTQAQVQTVAVTQELRNDIARNVSMATGDGQWLPREGSGRKLLT